MLNFQGVSISFFLVTVVFLIQHPINGTFFPIPPFVDMSIPRLYVELSLRIRGERVTFFLLLWIELKGSFLFGGGKRNITNMMISCIFLICIWYIIATGHRLPSSLLSNFKKLISDEYDESDQSCCPISIIITVHIKLKLYSLKLT